MYKHKIISDSHKNRRFVAENLFEYLSVFSAGMLFIVWALPGTIAARNISIVVGLIASIAWVFFVRPKISWSNLIVPVLLMGVPIWLWVIYIFFPIDSVAQYKEMTGTWLRIFALIFFGYELGLILSHKNRLAIWILISLASLPLASILIYFKDVYITEQWNIANYISFYKTKVAGVYFLTFAGLVACAGIHKALVNLTAKSISFECYVKLASTILLAMICF